MAILATLFGMLGRFAGKLLTTTLGWASILLFGRVAQDRQVVLALVTFGSVVWAVLVLGVLLPYVGAFLLAAVPAPALIREGVLRLAMLIAALLLPAVVGAATIFVVEPARRPTGRAVAEQVLRGYLLSPALAFTLILLALVGVARFVHHLGLRWSDAHIPIVVRPGGYDRVLVDLERALDDAGLDVERHAGAARPPGAHARRDRRGGDPIARPRSIDGAARPWHRGRPLPERHRDRRGQAHGCPRPRGDCEPVDGDRSVDDDIGRSPGDRGSARAPERRTGGRRNP